MIICYSPVIIKYLFISVQTSRSLTETTPSATIREGSGVIEQVVWVIIRSQTMNNNDFIRKHGVVLSLVLKEMQLETILEFLGKTCLFVCPLVMRNR